jgi:predicted nucleic acid-binding protein
MKVVDTTLLIGHARGDSAVEHYLIDHETETLVVPMVVFRELAVGEVLARGESKAAILGHLGAFDVRAFDGDHAYHAAVIEADLRERGAYEPRLTSDIAVAGVARSLDVPVLTRNAADFERFDDVDVETY